MDSNSMFLQGYIQQTRGIGTNARNAGGAICVIHTEDLRRNHADRAATVGRGRHSVESITPLWLR